MDYERIIEALIAGCDLSTETSRKIAWKKCKDHAWKNLQSRVAFNEFMKIVSDRLGLPAIRRSSLHEEIGDPCRNAKLHLRYVRKVGPELTGNAKGLRYLAALCSELAREGIENDHTHLYADEPPMYGRSHPLVIYHEPDSWFEKLDDKEDNEKSQTITRRDIDPTEIAALCILERVPPDILLTPRRAYRVDGVAAYHGQRIWKKDLRDNDERQCVFTLQNDEGVSRDFAFDLDDPEILFLLRQDIESLLNSD